MNKLISRSQLDSLMQTCPVISQGSASSSLRKAQLPAEIEQAGLEANIKPNPASDYLYVDVLSALSSELQIRIYTTSGELVKTLKTRVEENISKTIEIQSRNFSPGIYILDIQTGKEQLKKRVAIVR